MSVRNILMAATGAVAGWVWTPRESVRNWASVASSSDGTKLVAVVNNDQIYTGVLA